MKIRPPTHVATLGSLSRLFPRSPTRAALRALGLAGATVRKLGRGEAPPAPPAVMLGGRPAPLTAAELAAILRAGGRSAEHVLLAPDACELASGELDLRYVLPTAAPALVEGGPVLVPSRWLRDVLGAAKGRGAVVRFTAYEARDRGDLVPWVQAAVGSRGLQRATRPMEARRFVNVVAPSASEARLAPADFAKGGAVPAVMGAAGDDKTRPHLRAVHVGKQCASACDGHMLARRALARPLEVPALVPIPFVEAVCALVAATSPIALVLRRDDAGAVFAARCANGARWMLSGKLADASKAPDYDVVAEGAPLTGGAWVDLAEARLLIGPFARPHLAVYAGGGMVAWGEHEGAGCTLEQWSGEKPIAMFGPQTIEAALAMAAGPTVRIAMDMESHKGMVGDIVVMGIGEDDVPDYVRGDFQLSFGVAPHVQAAPASGPREVSPKRRKGQGRKAA